MMAFSLQKTKLFVPPARARLVERPRLRRRLDGLLTEGCRAALISAQAGAGKTTIFVQWLAGTGWPVCWLSLDARDNQPARFFNYLIAALQNAVPGAGSAAAALLDLPGLNPDEVITLLANDLAAAPGPFVLALDDLHAITNPLLHHALDLLIEAQPPQMRLALLSRQDPAIPLARRRARGELVELRQEDLRFTLEEALAFLNESMELRLTTGQVETLEARTEGWIAGLQMAALALREARGGESAAGVESFLRDFSGSHRFILDFLIEEVLARQPAEVQGFLLETATVERMCAELCAAVTGRTTAAAQKLLEQLAAANLFVIPLDEIRRWYRYHHLFRDLLLARLQAEAPARRAELELGASSWYEASGDARQAVEYAFQAGDAQRAADLFDRHMAERWQTVDLDFHLLLNRLPVEVMAGRPALCLQSAWVNVILGQTARILPFVETAERALAAPGRLPEPGDAASRAFARALRDYLADLNNHPVELDGSLEQALASIPRSNPGMYNSVAVIIGTIYYMEGDFGAALRCFESALALDQQVQGTNAVPIATMRIAFVCLAQGRLRAAVQRLSQSADYVRVRGSRRFYISGAINVMWGAVLLEWNRLEEADAQVREGLRLLDDWPIPAARALAEGLLARLLVARADLDGAAAAFDRADALLQQSQIHPLFREEIERARVDLLVACQDRGALEAWARANEAQAGLEMRFRFAARQLELCRAWLALGRGAEAASLLERLDAAARDGHHDGYRVRILALLAAATGSSVALDQALRLGEPEGYLRSFLEAGEPLRLVLQDWLDDSRAREDARLREFARRVLALFPGAAPRTVHGDLAEPLSPREREVLHLLAGGLTNQQIASQLVISVRTVKKHVENIHGKLGVQNRTQAVARARAIGLLP